MRPFGVSRRWLRPARLMHISEYLGLGFEVRANGMELKPLSNSAHTSLCTTGFDPINGHLHRDGSYLSEIGTQSFVYPLGSRPESTARESIHTLHANDSAFRCQTQLTGVAFTDQIVAGDMRCYRDGTLLTTTYLADRIDRCN